MSQSQVSTSYSVPQDRREDPTALGSRENFWGEEPESDECQGHDECTGTTEAEYIARQLVLDFVEPICGTTIDATPNRGLRPLFAWLEGDPLGKGTNLDALHHENEPVELTDPCLYLPKQYEEGGRIVSYGQVRQRRRYNPETGYVNWGETTSTEIPQFDAEIFESCVKRYLVKRLLNAADADGEGLRLTDIDEYREQAWRFWHDQQLDALGALEKFVAYVRDKESE